MKIITDPDGVAIQDHEGRITIDGEHETIKIRAFPRSGNPVKLKNFVLDFNEHEKKTEKEDV